MDYIFRWLATKFLSPEAQFRAGVNMREEAVAPEAVAEVKVAPITTPDPRRGACAGGGERRSTVGAFQNQEDAPPCSTADRS